jgi:hypothetical protein
MNKTTTLSKLCSVTGEMFSVTVRDADLAAWKNGMLIQNAMPDLNADEREFVMTRITPAEWDRMWAE